MAGKRINLAELADEAPLADARIPSFAGSTSRSARLEQVAPNPLNTRDLRADRAKIQSIADSLSVHGQLQPCAVVSRSAFLSIFPEHEGTVGGADYVQVTGGRRRAGALLAKLPTLDITVKNQLAASRAEFIGATAAENIERQDYDPVEEAHAVRLLVQECGSGKAAAEQLSRTPPWVTQRLNLLKLVPELQAALRAGEIPLRGVRDLHKLAAVEQVAALTAWRVQQQDTESAKDRPADASGDVEPPPPATRKSTDSRMSATQLALRRLGGTPSKIAATLRVELSPTDLRSLIEELTRRG